MLGDLMRAVGATRRDKSDLVVGEHGIFLKPVGGHDTDPFAAQDVNITAAEQEEHVRINISDREVWLVGFWTSPRGQGWEFVGVYSSEARAWAACTSPEHFISSTVIDRGRTDK